jgi:1-pyrroline-4-hydroxy-2-carboxylate deaminase
MNKADWRGVFPAITTPFDDDGQVDEGFVAKHVSWLIEHGCTGIVPLGSLGEGNTLRFDEKVRILEVCRSAIDGKVPLVAGISALSTGECVELAGAAAGAGCDGLMVLPAYVHRGDEREVQEHFTAVITATDLPCMLYNNPIAYGVELTADMIGRLAESHENVQAVKDSSGDVRRLTEVREVLGDRLALFAGLDDMVMETALMGGDGWVAGMVNALPEESVRLFELARSGSVDEAWELYRWFLPILRLDTVPKFVQLIKLVQAEKGMGRETVRPPRLPLKGREREEALGLIRSRLVPPRAAASSAVGG